MPVTEHGGLRRSSLSQPCYPPHGLGGDDDLALILRGGAIRTRTAVERLRCRTSSQGKCRSSPKIFWIRREKRSLSATDAEAIMIITTRLLGQHLDVSICAYADMEPDQDHFTIRGDWGVSGLAVHLLVIYSLADFGRLAVVEPWCGRGARSL